MSLIAAIALSTAAGAVAVFGSTAQSARSAARARTDTFTFTAQVKARYPPTTCPAGSPVTLACFNRTGQAVVRGLGTVNESYTYMVEDLPAGCDPQPVRVLPATVRLNVAGNGAIEIRVAGTGCLSRVPPNPLEAEEAFTVTGGSGRYAGASGGGTLHHVSDGPPAWRATDTWTGTLVVPGLSFDLIEPTIKGAANKLVHVRGGVKRVRVAYAVTAQDDVDGTFPATCLPKSRNWFKVGRTTVRCSASDTSGNETKAMFVVTVKPRR
jgi:hypothetical protein